MRAGGSTRGGRGRRDAAPAARAAPILLIGTLAAAIGGCNFDQEGRRPPPTTLNYPVDVELAGGAPGEAPGYLLVANSNFDLRYNTGTVQVFDVDRVVEAIERQCASEDGGCVLSDLAPLLADEVAIGSHASGLEVSPDGRRLYLPVRSERELTFLDFDPATGRVSCGAEGEDGETRRCSDAFRAGGRDQVATERDLALAGDPVAVATGRLEDVGAEPSSGAFVLLALRDGRVALFLDAEQPGTAPELVHIAGGFAEDPVTLTMQPGTGVGWLTSARTDSLGRVAIAVDPFNRSRSFLYDFGALRVGGIDDGEDLRDLEFHPEEPDLAYVLSRDPEAVVTLDLSRRGLTAVDIGLGDVYEVGAGPSRLSVARLQGRTYALASCFDAQKLFVIDLDFGALVSVVGGFSGPFDIVVDEARQLLFMADFTTSVVRVVDLAPLSDNRTPRLIATLGEPVAPAGLGTN